MNRCLTVLEIILAIFLPPLVVFMERGCTIDILINILFCLFGWIPGVIHAIYIIFTKPKVIESDHQSQQQPAPVDPDSTIQTQEAV